MYHKKEKRQNYFKLFICLLSLSILLIGCTNDEKGKTDTSKVEEKMLTIAWPRDLGEMNPHVYNPSQMFAQSMIYEPLVSYGENGELKPQLAEKWDVSKDGKTYTFHLRQGVKFSDGTDFNAAIVKRNFDAILKNVATHSWLGVMTKIETVTATDEYTVSLQLTEPYYATIQELAVVRPVRFLGEAGFPTDDDTSKGIEAAVGTGPWVLEEYKVDEYATFVRNENYWGEIPTVEKVRVKIIPDAETRVLAFEKGELDLLYGEGVISIDAFKQLEATNNYETTVSEPFATRLLVMNTRHEQLADLRVRQALHYGFNKEAMVEGITSGLEKKADYILSKNFPYTSENQAQVISYDVEKANALLDEAGWKLPGGKTVREKDGQPLEIELMYDTAESIQKTMAETLQSEWATLGVKLNIVGVELTEQIKRFKADEFQMNFFSNYGSPYDPHTFVNIVGSEGFGFNGAISSYKNKDVLLQQIQDVLKSTDEQQRQQLYTSILTSLQDQGALVPISYINKIAIYQKNVSNFSFSANRDENPFNGISLE